MDESAGVSRRALLRGVAGATAASTAAGTAAAQEGEGEGGSQRPVFPGYVDDAAGGEYADLRGESSVTVEVGAGSDQVAFAPTNIWVDEGTEVVFEWVSNGHNVLPNSQPGEADWGGYEQLEDEGFTYSHTFETGGMYTYFCSPHESLGMKGAVAVGEDVETESTGGGSAGPQVPDAAKSLGVAAGFAMAATLGLAYFFIKYGGDYGPGDTSEG